MNDDGSITITGLHGEICARPGDLVFSTQAPMIGANHDSPPFECGGSFVFANDGRELFRIDPDGTVFVRGDRCTGDRAMYEAFAEWLRREGVLAR